ncbi:recombinase family protein [Legionella fallonii]|uniref:Resolvase n=1 Tax=Legionella fallonii LLAP-10 TaxID=1212491 RepID=A0A098G9Q8_9GAMM|nr:recombinase family protein [Legionella fallonii]CEG59183.1 resolvase [Legionella fallonii LLAP-10]
MNDGLKYGYARVSTKEQNLDLQVDALTKAGCHKIFREVAKGAKTDRPKLNELLSVLKSGDTLIIWKLDRMGRSLQHLITTFNELIKKGIGIISIQDPIDGCFYRNGANATKTTCFCHQFNHFKLNLKIYLLNNFTGSRLS